MTAPTPEVLALVARISATEPGTAAAREAYAEVHAAGLAAQVSAELSRQSAMQAREADALRREARDRRVRLVPPRPAR